VAMEGFFDLQTPEHLLHKLEWEYTQWQDDPLNTYRAWNFFVTAEHLPDWIARTGPRLPKGFSINDFKQEKPPTAHLLAPSEWRQALQAQRRAYVCGLDATAAGVGAAGVG
jgi:hypothetical protein